MGRVTHGVVVVDAAVVDVVELDVVEVVVDDVVVVDVSSVVVVVQITGRHGSVVPVVDVELDDDDELEELELLVLLVPPLSGSDSSKPATRAPPLKFG